MTEVSRVKQQEAATRASQSNRQRSRSNATKETEDTSRIRMDVITPPPPECGLNRVYLAAGCVCAGRTPRASCQIDPIWCSSVSGPRELNNLNPGASPYLNYLIGAGN